MLYNTYLSVINVHLNSVLRPKLKELESPVERKKKRVLDIKKQLNIKISSFFVL